MTLNQEEIRQRILASLPPTPPAPVQIEAPVAPPAPVKADNSMLAVMTVALGCCIVVMSLALFFVLPKKKPVEDTRVDDRPPIVHTEPSRPTQPQVVYATKDELDKAMASLSQRIDKLNSRVDTHQKRIWLLAVANNENVVIRQQVETRWHGVADGRYIIFDENWKFNRMPDTMQMDEQSQKRLKENVKTKW
jgi:hypothetical protein